MELMNEKVEASLKAIEEQIAAIRAALGGEQQQENPMITPEKPAGGGGSMRDFLGVQG